MITLSLIFTSRLLLNLNQVKHETFSTILPLYRPTSAKSKSSKIIQRAQTLSSVSSDEAGTRVTHTFLSELKSIAKLSGNSFEDILREELTRITETIGTPNQ